MTGVPGPLLVVRVLLVLWTGIVALVYFLSLVGLGVVEPAWFERQSGLTRGTVLALTVIVVLRLPFQVHVATPRTGAGRARACWCASRSCSRTCAPPLTGSTASTPCSPWPRTENAWRSSLAGVPIVDLAAGWTRRAGPRSHA